MYEAEHRLSRAGASTGSEATHSSVPPGATEHEETEDGQERELLAFACWTLDKVAKPYLRA